MFYTIAPYNILGYNESGLESVFLEKFSHAILSAVHTMVLNTRHTPKCARMCIYTHTYIPTQTYIHNSGDIFYNA